MGVAVIVQPLYSRVALAAGEASPPPNIFLSQDIARSAVHELLTD
jgi:hypothetical protein